MGPFEKVALYGLATPIVIVLLTLLGPLCGALSGWLVSVVMPGWVTGGFLALGLNVQPDQLVAVGAALGFVSPFFRSYHSGK